MCLCFLKTDACFKKLKNSPRRREVHEEKQGKNFVSFVVNPKLKEA